MFWLGALGLNLEGQMAVLTVGALAWVLVWGARSCAGRPRRIARFPTAKLSLLMSGGQVEGLLAHGLCATFLWPCRWA